ncbi:DsbC family protein [Thermomonas sp.]|jgi:thiol:disulfide interchange protein DsbC|uniref:DsbC family protein n=1 Tax=Thermomonas sp. TaxID=1971895 RepID=UPI001AC58BEB|nr:DsbC family protein [Xanthomonadales bacterium]MBN8767747.1 DsbC family protein [Stenotrophomonas sp.]
MKQLVLALLLGFSLSACAQSNGGAVAAKPDADVPAADLGKIAAGSPEARARAAVQALGEGVRIERIGPAPIPGFRQVVAGGTVLYVSDDGKYLFQGGLVDVAKRQDLSEAAMAQVRKDILASLPEADRIVFAPKGAPRHTVVVLTDIECGYCRKFHSEIGRYNALGIRVEYLAFPRAGLGSDDYRKMVAVWCAPDRRKALTDAKNDRPVPLASTCTRTPVDMQYRAGLRMGLEGTPMILALDGRMVGGYLPPERLAQRLDALDAP